VLGHEFSTLLVHEFINNVLTPWNVSIVNSYWWRFLAEISPGLTLSLVGLLAATPAYRLLRQSGRGRARSAVAYLAGLITGLALTLALATVFKHIARTTIIAEAGVLSAFFAPFAGMLVAKWERPVRRVRSNVRREALR
jgi:predicted lysophospholipase L1 biosynthesis ABC-type transport system permease subunit